MFDCNPQECKKHAVFVIGMKISFSINTYKKCLKNPYLVNILLTNVCLNTDSELFCLATVTHVGKIKTKML